MAETHIEEKLKGKPKKYPLSLSVKLDTRTSSNILKQIQSKMRLCVMEESTLNNDSLSSYITSDGVSFRFETEALIPNIESSVSTVSEIVSNGSKNLQNIYDLTKYKTVSKRLPKSTELLVFTNMQTKHKQNLFVSLDVDFASSSLWDDEDDGFVEDMSVNRLVLSSSLDNNKDYKLKNLDKQKFHKLLHQYMSLAVSFINSVKLFANPSITYDGNDNEITSIGFSQVPVNIVKHPGEQNLLKNIDTDKKITIFNIGENNKKAKSNLDQYSVDLKDQVVEIAGYDDIKIKLEKIVKYVQNEKLYKSHGVTQTKGYVFYGPPGTGKTTFAKWLAKKFGDIKFVYISYSTIVSKWVGESESKIAEIFDQAYNYNGKVMIFLDEADGLLQARSEGEKSYNNTNVNTFLEKISGINSKDNVFFVAATNFVGAIDEAMTRSGRLEKLEIPLPDENTRGDIFNYYFNVFTKSINPPNREELSHLAEITEGFSGADIQKICTQVAENVVEESIKSTKNNATKITITKAGYNEILSQTETVKKLMNFKQQIGFKTH